MAVFTEVSRQEAAALMAQLNLGTLTALRGIKGFYCRLIGRDPMPKELNED